MSRRNELYHYGIKGQKWGVRRFQNKDGSLTPAGKNRYSSSQVRFEKAYKPLENKKLNENDYSLHEYIYSDKNKMRTNEILLPKGLQLTRVSTLSDEQKAKALYVNFVKDYKQVDYYKKSWPYQVDSITGKANDWYENTFTLSADIKAPSLERRMQAANAIVNADENLKMEIGKEYCLRSLSKDNWYAEDYIPRPYSESFEGIRKYYKDFKDKAPKKYQLKVNQDAIKEDIDDMIKYYEKHKHDKFDAMTNSQDFNEFIVALPRSKKLMSAYINELKKDGFDAVFDDNAGAKAAFIIFDAKNMNQVGSEKFDVDYSYWKGDPSLPLAPWIEEKLKKSS